jgi:hypothetical protein
VLGVPLLEMTRTVRFFKFAQPVILGCFAILGSNRGSTRPERPVVVV